MLVTIFHNIASDPQGRSLANFYGYSPGHPLVPVFRYNTELNMPDLIGDEAYRLFNVGDDPEFGPPDQRAVAYRAAKNRSLSKGDVLLVGGAWLACATAGWDEVRRPTFLARNAAQHGTTPLDDSNHLRDVTLADPKRELELTDPYTVTAARHEAALGQLDAALIGEPDAAPPTMATVLALSAARSTGLHAFKALPEPATHYCGICGGTQSGVQHE